MFDRFKTYDCVKARVFEWQRRRVTHNEANGRRPVGAFRERDRGRIDIEAYDFLGHLGKQIAAIPLATGNIKNALLSAKISGKKITMIVLVLDITDQSGNIPFASYRKCFARVRKSKGFCVFGDVIHNAF
jgi:hypothetical protein